MSRHFVITLVIPIGFAIVWLISCVTFQRKEITSFESWLLTKQVNYASDAAIAELLVMNPDIDLDYNSTTVTVLPDPAVDEFASMLCEELQLPTNDFNKKYVLNVYTKVLIVATNNGYYVYQSMKDSDHDAEFVSTPKLPYAASAFINGTQRFYAVTLSKDHVYYSTFNSGGNRELQSINYMTEETNGAPFSAGDLQTMSDIINNCVSDSLQEALVDAYGNTTGKTVEIPAAINSIKGSQPIVGPTVLAVVDTSGYKIGINAMAYGIGGAQIISLDPCVCWTDPGGVKWWAHSSALKRSSYDTGDMHDTDMYNTPFEAADHGYTENWSIMGH